ncbi:hypothetical protein CA831_10260 [Burkholderia multivorans]|nr:hypothetical protein CA831_10260 [Burkholderia multivorans]RAC99775.1 hypothetical protein DN503_11270 [Burkholderia multivorans]
MSCHAVTWFTISEGVSVVRNTKQDQLDAIETTIDGAIDRCAEANPTTQRTRSADPPRKKRAGRRLRTLSPAEHADLVQLVTSSLASLSAIHRMLMQ